MYNYESNYRCAFKDGLCWVVRVRLGTYDELKQPFLSKDRSIGPKGAVSIADKPEEQFTGYRGHTKTGKPKNSIAN